MRYLVTGGAGFIGTNIVKQLLADHHEVVILDNYSGGRRADRLQKGAQYIEGDIRNQEDLKKATQGVQGVFHLAAVPRVPYSVEHPQETNENNINGTLNVLIAARDAGVKRLVFSSSSSIYGGDKGEIDLTEDMLPSPKSPYALQKLTGEHYCRLFAELYNLQTVSLRYFNIYGPYLDPEGAYALVIGKFLRQSAGGQPLTICGDGQYFRDYTHVSDVVRANILAITKDTVGKGEIINIGNGQPYSVNQVAAFIGGPTTKIPSRTGDVLYSKADITKAKQLLGWEPTITLPDGIVELKKLFAVV